MTAGSPEQRGRPAPHRAAVGAVAGSAATMVMSAVMAAARAAGMLGEAPPRILAHQAAAAGGGPDSRGARDVLAWPTWGSARWAGPCTAWCAAVSRTAPERWPAWRGDCSSGR